MTSFATRFSGPYSREDWMLTSEQRNFFDAYKRSPSEAGLIEELSELRERHRELADVKDALVQLVYHLVDSIRKDPTVASSPKRYIVRCHPEVVVGVETGALLDELLGAYEQTI